METRFHPHLHVRGARRTNIVPQADVKRGLQVIEGATGCRHSAQGQHHRSRAICLRACINRCASGLFPDARLSHQSKSCLVGRLYRHEQIVQCTVIGAGCSKSSLACDHHHRNVFRSLDPLQRAEGRSRHCRSFTARAAREHSANIRGETSTPSYADAYGSRRWRPPMVNMAYLADVDGPYQHDSQHVRAGILISARVCVSCIPGSGHAS